MTKKSMSGQRFQRGQQSASMGLLSILQHNPSSYTSKTGKDSKEAALKGEQAADIKRLSFAEKHNFDAAQPASVRRLISLEIH